MGYGNLRLPLIAFSRNLKAYRHFIANLTEQSLLNYVITDVVTDFEGDGGRCVFF